jgi:hypothetical protein
VLCKKILENLLSLLEFWKLLPVLGCEEKISIWLGILLKKAHAPTTKSIYHICEREESIKPLYAELSSLGKNFSYIRYKDSDRMES